MEPAEASELFRMRFLSVRRVRDPEKPVWQPGRINVTQDGLDYFRHESLMRELMAKEEVRESLQLIVSLGKDPSANRSVLGVADENSQKEVEETCKDFGPKQTGEFGDVKNDFWW